MALQDSKKKFFERVEVVSILSAVTVGVATGWIMYMMGKNQTLSQLVPPQYRPTGSGSSGTTTIPATVPTGPNGQQPTEIIYVYGGTTTL